MKSYYGGPTLFRTVPSTTPYGLPFPKIGVRNPNPKLQSLLSQERVKIRTANLADTFTAQSEQKPIKIWEKKERGRFQGRPIFSIFFEYPLLSQEWLKVRPLNFVRTFTDSIAAKAH